MPLSDSSSAGNITTIGCRVFPKFASGRGSRMRQGHIKLSGYPAALLGFWLLSTAMLSGGAWFIQEWRYRDLAAHPSGDQVADRPVYVSSGQMQVVNGDSHV